MNNSYTSISVYGEDSDVDVILAAGRLAGLKITNGNADQPQSQPNVANTDKDKDKDNPNNTNKGKKQETKEDMANCTSAEQELDTLKRSKPKRGLKLTTGKECIRGKFAAMRFIANTAPESKLAGRDQYENAMVDQWMEYAADDHNGLGKAMEREGDLKVLGVLEDRLRSHKFVAIGHITIADLVIANALSGLNLSSFPSVKEFHQNIMMHHCFDDYLNGEKKMKKENSSNPMEAEEKLAVFKGVTLQDVPDNSALNKLSELGISHQTYAHKPAFTVQEQMESIRELEGAKTKNLFLRDKKHGLFLVTASHDAKTDTKTIASILKLSGANLRFADAATLDRVLGVAQGSVGPLALLNDSENKEVTFVIDAALLESEIINSHPLRNDLTTAVASSDILCFAEATGHPPVILDFSEAAVQNGSVGCGGKANVAASRPQREGLPGPQPKSGKKKHHGRSSESTKNLKKETLLGIEKSKAQDFSGWYQQVITFSEMIDYSDISGCYILRPWGYEIWEQIQRWFDDRIKELGVSNSYFPLFVSQKALESEKNHVEGFAPEVAWVTKSGDTDLTEPIAVRPTSETIMYPAFSRWIRSHRDLPLKLNQWSNIVRWEFRDPTPFLRSREFLWQEGHTVHTTFEEAEQMVYAILELYKRVYEELLAVPVIKGLKTESEKFAGGLSTTTVEAYIYGSGRAIQGATSHNLGQNFGKMFNISYESKQGQHEIPWQTSWGLTTRAIGVCVMCHGDDMGLVLPPRVAPRQVVVIPIFSKKFGLPELSPFMSEVVAELRGLGIRVEVDLRDNYTAGWKYNHWEQKGVPIRIEIGPHDVKARSIVAVRRDDGSKHSVVFGCGGGELGEKIQLMLDEIQSALFSRALQETTSHYSKVTCWDDFVPALEKHDIVLAPFCNETEWEEKVKERSREEALYGGEEDNRVATSVAAKSLCIPLEQPDLPPGTQCFISGKPAVKWVLWGRSY